jgi:enamine deaminase RidA (YjgF/YER057c/UK114 family)
MHQDRRRAWARAVLVLVALLALLVVLAPAAAAQTAPTTTTPPPNQSQERCDTIPNPVAKNVCQLGTNPGQAVTNVVSGAAQNVVQTAGDSALRSFTAAVASAGKFFLEKVGSLVTNTTSPNVVSPNWFTSQYRVMLALAVVIALPILLVSVAQSIVRADGMQAIRSAFVYLPIAAILSAVGPAMAQILIDVSDWMSAALSNNASADAQKFMTDAGSALAALGAGTLNPAAPVFGVLLGALIVVLGALSIWLELLLRSAAIYISVLFLPLALAAMIWPAGWKWCRRLIEFLIAIIFAKVFIVAIVNLAAAGLARGGLGDKFEGVLAGGALLLMAAFTPIALLKLIPLAEAAVVTAGHQRAALRQATAGATALTTSSSVVSSMIQTRFRSGAATAAAPAAGWAAPAAATVGAMSAARNRATSSFAAMSSVGDVGGDSAAPASGRNAPRPGPVNAGGSAGSTRPLKLPELERAPDA